MSALGSIVLQNSKLAVVWIFGETQRSVKRSLIRTVSFALPTSLTNLAQGDEVPQIIARIMRQRPSEILISPVKTLLQHYLPRADVDGHQAAGPLRASGRHRASSKVNRELNWLGREDGSAPIIVGRGNSRKFNRYNIAGRNQAIRIVGILSSPGLQCL